jgi:hypothetical protein
MQCAIDCNLEDTEMLKTICLLFLASALLAPGAHASEMFFSTDDVGQMWLQIVGRIDDGDDVKFKNMLVGAINRGEQIERISIYSPGGRAGPAMRIGRYIRTMHLSTIAPRLVPLLGRQTCDIHTMGGQTTVLEYEPIRNRGDPRCMCAGECFLIWAGGSVRYGDGVQIRRIAEHAEEEGKRSGPPATHLRAGHESVQEYLEDMGVPEGTVSRIFNIPPDTMEHLTKHEREVLTNPRALPLLGELVRALCPQHLPTSPAMIACEKAILRDLYWEGAKELLAEND